MLKRYHSRRASILEQLGGQCKACVSKENLEIDHIDPDQKSHELAGKLSSLAKLKLEAEIEKCQLLCGDCHTEKTLVDNGFQRTTHGTTTMYCHHKCRCEICRTANSVRSRAYKSKRVSLTNMVS